MATRRQGAGLAAGLVLTTGLVALRAPLLVMQVRDYDEGVYWESVRRLVRGDALAGAVYTSQPPGFLPQLVVPYRLLGEGLTALRVGILAAAVVGAVAGAWLAWRLAGSVAAALVTALLLMVDPILLRASVTVQAEAPMAALALVAAALAVESAAPVASRTRVRADAMAALAGVALAAAVLTKLLAVAALPAIAVLLAGAPGPRRVRRLLLGALGALAMVVAVTGGLLAAGDLGAAVRQAVGLHLGSRSIDEGGVTPELRTAVLRELPLLAVAVTGGILWWRRGRAAVVALGLWAVAALAAVAVQHPLWPHHLVALGPPLAVLGGLAVPGALETAAHRGGVPAVRTAAVLLAAALVAATAVSGAVAEHELSGLPAQTASAGVVAALRRLVPAGATVVTDDQGAAAAADLDTPPELVDTSLVRIMSGDLRVADVEGIIARDHVVAVLFGTGRLDHLPGFRAWVAARFPVVDALGEAHTLYGRPPSGA